ncbi:MAG: hypothetical protein V1909_06890, partial [Candidatus Micrarchaeota archaeon]
GMEKKSPLVGLGIGIVLLVLIFGLGISYLGVFNLKPAASAGLGSSETSSGLAKSSGDYGGYYNQGPTYHVFNYFNSGALSLMLVLGIIIALAMVNSLYSKTDSLLASLLYIIGTLLLFSSATILLFGVHDLINFSGHGETTKKPSIMQQYGWMIESVLFGALGAAFVWAAERIRKQGEEHGSLVYLAVTPVAALLVLFTIPVFFFGLHGAIYSNYGQPSFSWVIETIIFGGLGALLFNWIDRLRHENSEKGFWREYPLFATGYALLLPATFIFIFGVLDYLHNQYARDVWRPFVETLVLAPIGFAAFYLVDWINKKEKEYHSTLPNALAPIGTIFLIAATFAFAIGFSSWLRADITASNYRTAFAWVVDTILFGIIGYAAMSISDKIKNKTENARRDLPKAVSASGLLLWVASLFFYGLAVHSFVYDKEPQAKLVVEFLVYGVIGFGLTVLSDRMRAKEGFPKERALPKVLAFSGGLLLLATLLVFIFDLHNFLYSEEPQTKWILRVLGYGIAGAAYLLAGNSMEPIMQKKEKERPKPKPKQEIIHEE